MIIRLSRKDDIGGIVSLWNESFGDTAEEIMFFINNKYLPENTLVAEENGEIASVLFLLEGKMCIKGIDYPSYYLYAACTLKKYRGRGFMAKLLEEAEKIAALRAIDFICLMPGEKSLFDFYEKFGYKTVFNRKVLSVDVGKDIESVEIKPSDADDCEKIRNIAFSDYDYFIWDRQSIEFAFSHNKMYFGNDFCCCNGYFLYTTNDDTISVKEFAFADAESIEIAVNIAVSHNCNKLIMNLPSEYPTEIGESEIVPSAMMLAVNECSKIVSDGLKNAYLGLTLD